MGREVKPGGLVDFFDLPDRIQKVVLSKLTPGEKTMVQRYMYGGDGWDPSKAEEFGALLRRIRLEGNRRLKIPLPTHNPFEKQVVGTIEASTPHVVVEKPVAEKQVPEVKPVEEKLVPPVKPVMPDKVDELSKNWHRDDFSRFLIETAQGKRVGFEDFPERITPSKIWSEMIGKVGVKDRHQRTKVLVVVDKDEQVRFSQLVPEHGIPMGFNSSLVQDDKSGRYSLKVLGEIREQRPSTTNWNFYLDSVNPKTLYDFLTSPADLPLLVVRVGNEVFWLFASQETDAKKHGDFKGGYEAFRDRWLIVAGQPRRRYLDSIFHDDGIPWSNEDRGIVQNTRDKICEHYKIALCRQGEDGVLERKI